MLTIRAADIFILFPGGIDLAFIGLCFRFIFTFRQLPPFCLAFISLQGEKRFLFLRCFFIFLLSLYFSCFNDSARFFQVKVNKNRFIWLDDGLLRNFPFCIFVFRLLSFVFRNFDILILVCNYRFLFVTPKAWQMFHFLAFVAFTNRLFLLSLERTLCFLAFHFFGFCTLFDLPFTVSVRF